MNESRKNMIVDDLLLRYPKGVRRKLTKFDYNVDEKYDYSRQTHVKLVSCSSTNQYWGWSKEDLFDLNFKNSDQVERYVKNRWFKDAITHRGGYGSKRSTLTRRTRRIWERIKPAIDAVKEEGAGGVYKIKASSYSGASFGHIYASSKAQAESIASVMFFHVLTEADQRSNGAPITATLVSRNDIDYVMKANAKFFKVMTEEINRSEKRVKSLQEKVILDKEKLSLMRDLQAELVNSALNKE